MRACLAVSIHVIYTSKKKPKCSSSSSTLGLNGHSTNLPLESNMASDTSSTLGSQHCHNTAPAAVNLCMRIRSIHKAQ
jgi:hypothetical protein